MIKIEQDGAFVILFKDDSRREVFLVFRSDYPVWVLTGGGMEKGETPEQTAVREALEESGFKIKIVRKLWIAKKTSGHTTHVYEGRRISGEFKPEFPGCRDQWFNINHLPFETLYKTRVRIKEAANFSGEPITKYSPAARAVEFVDPSKIIDLAPADTAPFNVAVQSAASV